MENLQKCDLCHNSDIQPVDRVTNICKCNQCGYIFDNPRPAVGEIVSYYSKGDKYDNWIREEKGRDLLWQRRLKKIRKCKPHGTLLDIGTGIGQFLCFAQQYYKVSGTEISDSAIHIAKEKYNLDISKGQAESIDFKDKRFDIITLFHVLEHVPSPSRLIEKCYSLLNDNGILIIAVPNDIHSCSERLVKRLLSILKIGRFKKYGKYGLQKIKLDGSLSEIHLSHFTVKTLKTWLKVKRFRIIEDTLDPFYAAKGMKKVIHTLLLNSFLIIKKIARINIYYTIWIAAKKI